MRIQVTVDDVLGEKISRQAKDLGFSVSSYTRFLLNQSLNKQKNSLDKAILEYSESISLQDFKKQIKDL